MVAELHRQNGLMNSSPQDFKGSKDTVMYSYAIQTLSSASTVGSTTSPKIMGPSKL